MEKPSLRLGVAIIVCLLLSVGTLTCSKGDSPTAPDSQIQPEPNPEGVLLTGDTANTALSVLVTLPPYPAAEEEIVEDFITTRLQAIIDTDASVGAVNEVFLQHNVRIICMMPGIPMVTLKSEPLASRESADSLAELLMATAPILYACAAYVAGAEPLYEEEGARWSAARIAPGMPASNNITHLQEMKIPAAWNVRALVPPTQKVRVLVADEYVQLTRSSEISAQRFVAGGTATARTAGGLRVGNHGFHVCGILGADFDTAGATGAHPDAQTHLDILSFPIGGYSWFDMQAGATFSIGTNLPAGSFILNTSLGYNDTGFVRIGKYERALNMFVWRMLAASKQSHFLHVTSAGNDGLAQGESGIAKWCSPFNSAAKFASMADMLNGLTLTPDQQSTVNELVALAQTNFPGALSALTNVITVGALVSSGTPAGFSAREADVWAVGSAVYGPCVSADPSYNSTMPVFCSGTEAMYSGTSQAAPQIAGLAAYLWNIRPTLSVAQLKEIILRSKDGNQTNGYEAMLSLDQSLSGATMRKTLLDVASGPSDSTPDGDFDEHDLKRFAEKFIFYETERQNSGSNDIDDSRYDLNGDGYTGGAFQTDFDLDVNNPPGFTTVSQQLCGSARQFNELQVSDLEILIYYAYSSLYVGNQSARDSMMECTNPSDPVYHLLFNSSSYYITDVAPETLTIVVQESSDQGSGPVEGADVQIVATGASLTSSGGLTNSEGEVTTIFQPDAVLEKVVLVVTASVDGAAVVTDTLEIGIDIMAGYVGIWTGTGQPNMDSCIGYPVYPLNSTLTIGAGNFGTRTFTYGSDVNTLALISVTRTQIVAETWLSGGKNGDLIITKGAGSVCNLAAVYTRVYGCYEVLYSWNFASMVKTGCSDASSRSLSPEPRLHR